MSHDIDPLSNVHTGDVPLVETRIIQIDITKANNRRLTEQLQYPVELIRAGETVAFPTETVYGLGANALDGEAAKKIFLTKRRPADNPLICHISSEDMLSDLVSEIPDDAKVLMAEFWPGPLTLLFPKSSRVPIEVSAGQPTVAVRMPVHPIALSLISQSGVPIAAPSANLSGRPSPTSAEHVLHDLNGRVKCIIDGGATQVGLESTVVDVKAKMILRPGGVTLEQLREIIPDMTVFKANEENQDQIEKPATPGLKYRHYSPSTEVILLECNDPTKIREHVISLFRDLEPLKKRLGVIHTRSAEIQYPPELLQSPYFLLHNIGSKPRQVAQGLFHALRHLDQEGLSLIVMEGISEADEGLAVMNRIRKAASQTILL